MPLAGNQSGNFTDPIFFNHFGQHCECFTHVTNSVFPRGESGRKAVNIA
jgi:hypothetical protein